MGPVVEEFNLGASRPRLESKQPLARNRIMGNQGANQLSQKTEVFLK